MLILVIILVGSSVKRSQDREQIQNWSKRQTELLQGSQLQNENYKIKQENAEFKRRSQLPLREKVISEIRSVFQGHASEAQEIFACESNLDPTRVHVNNVGFGSDHGVAQINDKWHKSRFEKMFGVKFEEGIYNFKLNIAYAKYLYDHSGFAPWYCKDTIALK